MTSRVAVGLSWKGSGSSIPMLHQIARLGFPQGGRSLGSSESRSAVGSLLWN